MSVFKRIGTALLLLIAGGSGFLTVVAWVSTPGIEPVAARSDDAQLVMVTFGFVTVFSVLAAVLLMKSYGGGQ